MKDGRVLRFAFFSLSIFFFFFVLFCFHSLLVHFLFSNEFLPLFWTFVLFNFLFVLLLLLRLSFKQSVSFIRLPLASSSLSWFSNIKCHYKLRVGCMCGWLKQVKQKKKNEREKKNFHRNCFKLVYMFVRNARSLSLSVHSRCYVQFYLFLIN